MNYQQQAKDFLHDTNISFEAVQAVPQTAPLWAKDGKHGIQWSITLHKGDIHGKSIQFFFWDSIANKEKIDEKNRNSGVHYKYETPEAYAVLANIYTPVESFEEFCSNFGYDTDSITADRTYRNVLELNKKLESIFTVDELEKLQEIN